MREITPEGICMICHTITVCSECCKKCNDSCNSKQSCLHNEEERNRLMKWIEMIKGGKHGLDHLKKYLIPKQDTD